MTEDAQKYLIFTLAGERYALALAQVAEVMECPSIWPIPLAPPCYPGAMNFHGAIAAVMDLALFLGLRGREVVDKVIVLAPRIAALAFSVESIIRITPLTPSELLPCSGNELFSTGKLSLPEGIATLLDAAAITEHAAETINF